MRDFATKRTRVPEVAPEPKRKQKKPRNGAPPALWMLGGLLLGVLIAFGVVQHREKIQHWFAKKSHPSQKEAIAHKQKTKPKPKIAEKPQFDFYNILPNEGAGIKVDTAQTGPKIIRQFMVQVASYPSKQHAETLRARLLMLGFAPKIDATSGGWYRVDIGPVDSLRAGDVLRHKLQNAGIRGAMIRQISAQKVQQNG